MSAKRHAYVAVLCREPERYGQWMVGIAVENERGYAPTNVVFPDKERAEANARSENERLGLSSEEASMILISSMFPRKQ